MTSTHELIAHAYETYCDRLIGFFQCRINDEETSHDLTQEVFVRLLEYSQYIYESQLENFIYTIARNLVNDHLRRYYVRREFDRYYRDYMPVSENNIEHTVVASDLERFESRFVDSLPRQRAAVYRLKRYEEMSAKEIAARLGMSVRTVENHYYMGLKQVRAVMADCI
ncbi:MAG: sigma-70 family RNA polymerase sigma factor [Muribaculaceae bacterium]|nr:sigma-70 family RNA polymerase sigma factor [Muribaculaceae bacterium]